MMKISTLMDQRVMLEGLMMLLEGPMMEGLLLLFEGLIMELEEVMFLEEKVRED